jgi:hypothetical protein
VRSWINFLKITRTDQYSIKSPTWDFVFCNKELLNFRNSIIVLKRLGKRGNKCNQWSSKLTYGIFIVKYSANSFGLNQTIFVQNNIILNLKWKVEKLLGTQLKVYLKTFIVCIILVCDILCDHHLNLFTFPEYNFNRFTWNQVLSLTYFSVMLGSIGYTSKRSKQNADNY